MSERHPRPVRVSSSVARAAHAVFVIEGLERRQLYAATLPKIGDVLGYLANDFATRPEAAQSRSAIKNKTYTLAKAQPNADLVRTTGDTVIVKAVANLKGAKKLTAQLESIGAAVIGGVGYVLTAAVPVSALAKVNGLSTLQYADASYAPYTSAGKADSYGVQAMNAAKGAQQYAVDGTGVTVGILSDSYDKLGGAAAGVASGDLPAGVNVIKEYPFGTGGTDEGRAMAEIVHDVAPGANLAYYTAFQSEADFAAGIVKLAQPTNIGGGGAKVIVDDVGYLDEPFFQDGIVAQAVNTAANTYGASYFSAAGNNGRESYEATFNAVSTTVAGLGAGTYQDFDTSATVNPYQQVTIPAGGTIQLSFQWNAPYFSASANAGGSASPTNSVGVYLINSAKTGLLASAATNRVGGDAYQIMQYSNTGASAITAYVAMRVTNGSAPGYVKYIDYGGATINQFATNSGTSIGHAVATGGMGVGAAFYGDTPAFNVSPAVKEDFSSSGGVPIFFNANGTAAATTYRNQPSVVGPDGAANTFFGGLESTFDGQYHFFGTSAAAPHVAGVAALLLQSKPSLTNTQVYSALQTTAADMGTAGFDYDTGYGLVRADAALASVSASSITGTAFRDLNNNNVKDGSDTFVTGQTVFLDANNNGTADSGTGTTSNTTPLAIPDATATNAAASKVASSLVTNYGGRVTGLTVSINATHSRNGDLGFTLITPSGTRIPLLTNLGYLGYAGTGVNLTLSDASANYITNFASAGVLSGTYKPQTPLAQALNENASGTWQLEARDYRSGNTGTLNSWSLNVTYADPTATTNASGVYAFAGLTPSAFYGTYRVRTGALSGFAISVPASPYDLTLTAGTASTAKDFAFVSNTATLSTIAGIVLDDGTIQRSRIRTVDVTLNGTVTAGGIAAGAFTLTQTAAAAGGSISTWGVTVTAITTPAAGQTKISLAFTGPGLIAGSLADGRYNLLIDGSRVTNSTGGLLDAAGNSVAGSTRTVGFHKLYGDIDGNATVNFNDFLSFQTSFGSSNGNPAYLPGFDSDNNNTINFNDFLPFQTNFGNSI